MVEEAHGGVHCRLLHYSPYGEAQKNENPRAAHDHCVFEYSREQFVRDMEACGFSPIISIL